MEQEQQQGWGPASPYAATDEPFGVKDAATHLQCPPGPNHEERLAEVVGAIEAGRNPLMEAARLLLRTLAELPDDMPANGVVGLHSLVMQELRSFTRLCEQANVRRDHMLATRYALCTALDEAISAKPWAGGDGDTTGMWSTQTMLSEFHNEAQGGKKVFLLIGRLAHSPQEHMPVLEVIYRLLSLGFMGDYRTQGEGHRMVDRIRHRLFTMISSGREPLARELSPRWRGVGQSKFKLLRSIPLWVSLSVLGLALFAMFAWYSYQLQSTQANVLAQIDALAHLKPPATKPVALNLPLLLKSEIDLGVLRVETSDDKTQLVFKGDGMFSGGLTTLSQATEATLNKVGAALVQVEGSVDVVEVIGHTDSQRIRTPEFPNNNALSLARAQVVADVLIGQGVQAERLRVVGSGDSQPVASNASEAGRRQNRRVEMVVHTGQPATRATTSPANLPTAGAGAAVANQ